MLLLQAHLTVSANNPFAAPAPQNSQPYAVAAAAAGPESAGALKHGLRASQHYDQVRQQPHLAGGASWLQVSAAALGHCYTRRSSLLCTAAAVALVLPLMTAGVDVSVGVNHH